jgi:putative ubiquitin-RnfH superfamily antitoxin RatB of RatAB toxin-antitoxin module
MASAPEPPRIAVVYALPRRQRVVSLALREGMTAIEAVEASGLIAACPELAGRELPLGIFGCRVEPGQLLHDGDRVEIYRPLLIDPRESRRQAVRARSPRQPRRR